MALERDGGAPAESRPSAEGEDGPVGPFPSWGWLYAVVMVYGVLVIAALVVLSRLLDPGRP